MRLLALLLLLAPSLAGAVISFPLTVGTKAGGTSGTSMTPALPGSTIAGDVVVCIASARETAYAMSTATSGWTNKYEGATANARFGVWWMRQNGSYTAAVITRSTGAQAWTSQCFAARGVIDTGDPFDVFGTPTQTGSSPVTAAAVTTTKENSWPIVLYGMAGASTAFSTSSPTGTCATTTNMGQNATQGGTSNRANYSGYRASAAQASPGTTGTSGATWTPTTSSYMVSVQAALLEGPVGSGGMMGFWP